MNSNISANSDQAIQDFKKRIDIVELISQTETIVGNHAAHASKHDSANGKCLWIKPQEQTFHCFSCEARGDVIDWVKDRFGFGFMEAVDWLADYYNIPHPTLDQDQWQTYQAKRQESDLIRPILRAAFQFYQQNLQIKHYGYLLKRGIKEETVESLLIGYAPNGNKSLYRHLKPNYQDGDLLKSGLFYKNGQGLSDRYRDRYIFPYWVGGHPVFSIGRLPDDNPEAVEARPAWDRGKYIKHLIHSDQFDFVSETIQNPIWGSDTVKDANELVITEGIVDAILAKQAGYSVISPVTVKFKRSQIEQMVRLSGTASTIYIINDNEDTGSGLQGAISTAEALNQAGRSVRIVQLPRAEHQSKVDLADFLADENNDLEPILQTAPDYLQFQIDQLINADSASKNRGLRQVATQLARMPSFERDPYVEHVVDNGLMAKRAYKQMVKSLEKEQKEQAAEERVEKAKQEMGPEELLRFLVMDVRRNEDKLKTFEVKQRVSELIITDMIENGQLHYTKESHYYWFNNLTKQLFVISRDREDLQILINRRYGINASEAEYDYIVNDLIRECQTSGELTEVHRLAHFDPQNGLYVFNNDSQIYKLDGLNTPQLVPNGTDGVLFLGQSTHQPFTYLENTPAGYITKFLIETINFDGEDSNLEDRDQAVVFHVWLQSLFFGSIQRTKPIQCFIGEKGSGKSYSQKRVGIFLFGDQFNVNTLEAQREDDFIATVTNSAYCAFDNADSYISWLPDRLANLATGGKIERRKLYTDNEVKIYYPKCFISINARTPNFKRDDVMDRILPFKVKRYGQYESESRLTPQLLEARDYIWSELLDELNRITEYLLNRDDVNFNSNFRMADFAEFGWKVMRSRDSSGELSEYWEEILGQLGQAQTEELFVDDPIIVCLERWMENPDNHGRSVKGSYLYGAFSQIAEEIGIGMSYKMIGFCQKLAQISSNLQHLYEVKVTKPKNSKHYAFRPIADGLGPLG
jgi:DNA primase